MVKAPLKGWPGIAANLSRFTTLFFDSCLIYPSQLDVLRTVHGSGGGGGSYGYPATKEAAAAAAL